MEKRIYILLTILFAVQLSVTGKTTTAAPKQVPPAVQAQTPTLFDDISKKATEFVVNVGNQVNQLITSKDAKELQDILKNNTNEFVKKVSELADNFQKQLMATATDHDNIVGQTVLKLNQTVIDLQKQHPEITSKAEEIQENLQQGFKTVLSEADKLTKAISENTKEIQDDLNKLTKKTYDQVLKSAQTLQKQVHEYANAPATTNTKST